MKEEVQEYSFDDIRAGKDGALLIYEYVRGSTAYGLADPDSDVDRGGVYMEPVRQLFNIDLCARQDEVHDERHDTVWFSLDKFFRLLLKANPTVLEALFIPKEHVIYEHPIMTEIKEHAGMFLTKQCFGSFINYSSNQIQRARSLGKKIVSKYDGPRPTVLDMCWVPQDNGSKKVKVWLEENGLLQKFCGMVNIPHMRDTYGLYYDFASHLRYVYGIKNFYQFMQDFRYVKKTHNTGEGYLEPARGRLYLFIEKHFLAAYGLHIVGGQLEDIDALKIWDEHLGRPGLCYKGIVHEEEDGTDGGRESTCVRLSSVPKGEEKLAVMTFSKDQWMTECREWREYQEFKLNRNEKRFNLAKSDEFDRKNVMHCMRLLHMGLEIARGEGFHVDRRGRDAEQLRAIRRGEATYDEIMREIQSNRDEMMLIMQESKLPDQFDYEAVRGLLRDIRKKQMRAWLTADLSTGNDNADDLLEMAWSRGVEDLREIVDRHVNDDTYQAIRRDFANETGKDIL